MKQHKSRIPYQPYLVSNHWLMDLEESINKMKNSPKTSQASMDKMEGERIMIERIRKGSPQQNGTKIIKLLTSIDLLLLREQKEKLIEVAYEKNSTHLQGIINLLDNLQDMLVESKLFSSWDVFGPKR